MPEIESLMSVGGHGRVVMSEIIVIFLTLMALAIFEFKLGERVGRRRAIAEFKRRKKIERRSR